MTLPKSKADILRRIAIAIDGPSGSGKTTTAREVARRLKLRHIDTGAMYRAVTWKALQSGAKLDDADAIGQIADDISISFTDNEGLPQRVYLDNEDVSDAIRSGEVTRNVSLVSSHRQVRSAMVRWQRTLADEGGVVLEGRDIGSVVLPSADVKVYLDASVEVRADRRMRELEGRGVVKELRSVQADIERRDYLDRNREVSPLKIPIGAAILDTGALTIDGQVEEVVSIADRVAENRFAAVETGRGPNHKQKWTLIYFISKNLVLILARVLWGLRIVRKEDHGLTEPYIYASNHRSNADPPLVGSTIQREVYFVAKAALFKNKLFGWLIGRHNALPIRSRGFDRVTMDLFIQLLRQGQSAMIFPEGGRISGEALGPARPGVGYLALNTGVAVIPVYVEGSNRLLGGLIRRPRLTVIHGRPIRFTDGAVENYQNADGYREFGLMVMAAVESLQDEHLHGRGPKSSR